MTDGLTIVLAQLNPTVGDVVGNARRLSAARSEAADMGADLVVTTELALSGYPPEDLVVRPSFQETVLRELRALAAETLAGGPGMLVGTPWEENGAVYNAAVLLDDGRIADIRRKHDLPNYGVFDEKRVFAAGPLPGPINFRGVRLGVMVCEDMWTEEVVECLEESGAEILVVINGSPYEVDKTDQRLNLAVSRVIESRLPMIYVNQIGGQDELVFDGGSFVLGGDAALRAQAPSWREALLPTRWARENGAWNCETAARHAPETGLASVYEAMTLGLRDYVVKNGFPGVIIGLSGGIDSALTAAVAADALGPGPGALRDDAVALYLGREPAGRGRHRRRTRRRARHHLDRPGDGGLRVHAAAGLRQPAAGHHRGEHSGTRPRAGADGAVQQDRRDGGLDRQQIRDVGRLCDSLR